MQSNTNQKHPRVTNRIIRSIERFFGTDTRYLMSGGFWVTLGVIARMGVSFLLSIAYARYLLKGTYGDYRYVFSLLGIATVFTLPGLGQAMTRSIARGFLGTFKKAAKLFFYSSFGITIFGLGAALYSYFYGDVRLFFPFLIAGLLSPLVDGLGSWRAYFDGQKKFKEKSLYNIAIHIIYGVAMGGTVFSIYTLGLSSSLSVSLLVGTYFLAYGIPNLILFRRSIKSIPETAAREDHTIRYGIHLSASNVLSTIATYLDAVILFNLLGPASLAVYSFAIALPEQIKGFIGSSANIAFPKLSEKTTDKKTYELMRSLLFKKIAKASILTTLIVLAYILAAPLIYETFFPRYLESIRLSQVFALSLILFPFSLFGGAIIAEGSLKKIYSIRIIAPVIQIAALIILIPLFGLLGAVWARVIGRLFLNAVQFLIFEGRWGVQNT